MPAAPNTSSLLGTLIIARMAALGITPQTLAGRLGYANLNKGARRLREVIDGSPTDHGAVLSRLAVALEIAPELVDAAVQATRAAQDQAVRAAFVPHAVLLTERRTPTQITLCAVAHGERALHIAIDLTRPRATYVRQALAELNLRTDGGRCEVPFFGPARGFAVNYAPSWAVRYDTQGRTMDVLPEAVRIGVSAWSLA